MSHDGTSVNIWYSAILKLRCAETGNSETRVSTRNNNSHRQLIRVFAAVGAGNIVAAGSTGSMDSTLL